MQLMIFILSAPLASAEPFDLPLPPGNLRILMAYSINTWVYAVGTVQPTE
jgi:hypothetical protein